MLSLEVTELARRMTEEEFHDRGEQLLRDIAQIRADAIHHGVMGSSGEILNIRDRCATEIKERALLAWQVLRRVIETLDEPLSDARAIDLKSQVSALLISTDQTLTNILKKKVLAGGSAFGQTLVSEYPLSDAKELSRNNFPALSSVQEALAFQTRGFKPLVPSAKPGGY